MSDEADRAALGAKIKETREYRGYSQEDVATYLGIPRPAVSLIEAGTRRVEALELTKLSKLFQCTIDELTGTSAQTREPESIKMIARAAAGLSQEDRDEILQFAKFLQSRKQRKKE